MKLDKKFEERIKAILEKYAIRDDYVPEPESDIPSVSENTPDPDNADNVDNEDSENKSDGYETIDTAQFLELQKKTTQEQKDPDELLRKKYYFYYKILSKNELSDEMEDVYDDEIEELNTIQFTKGTGKDEEHFIAFINGNQSDKSDKKKNANNKKIAVIYFYDEQLAERMQEVVEHSSLFEQDPYTTLMFLFHAINDIRIDLKKTTNVTTSKDPVTESSNEPSTESVTEKSITAQLIDEDNKSENSETDEEEKKNTTRKLQLVLNFLEEVFDTTIKKMDKMIANNLIDFESLWYHFDQPGKIYAVKKYNDDKVCFRQKYFAYDRSDDIEYFYMTGDIITSKNKKLSVSNFSHQIKKFKGTKPISSFGIDVLTEEDRVKYAGFGSRIVALHDKITHMNVRGKQYIKKHQEIVSIFRNERVMVDQEGGELLGFDIPYHFTDNDVIDVEDMTEDDMIITYPYITMYNLGTNKMWGITHVDNLTPIVYSKDAFEYLVLEKKKKDIIVSLIKNYKDNLEDFINTKGKGLIFLLYGPPGVGKTLSAEATCELLEKPLYSVNVGDLGTHPDTMETMLDSINEYVRRWEAIILIDEVDIFLENRENSDITRNAMVCIFLKFLEYHDSIIFLTTNRLNTIDPAIKSRINMFLAYDELDTKMRKQVWKSLLGKGKIQVSEDTLKALSEHKLNGRELRNYLKLVISIHKEEKKEITEKSLLKTLDDCFSLTKEFDDKTHSHMYT